MDLIEAFETGDFRDAARALRTILTANFAFVLDRADARPSYPCFDTKYDLLAGRDVSADDPLRGPGTVYGWIQGRGLEALAGWARHVARDAVLPPAEREAVLRRAARILRVVSSRMEAIRRRMGGHLCFMFTLAGCPLRPDGNGRAVPADKPPARANLSDLFLAKGLAAAADVLKDNALAAAARELMETVWNDLVQGRFYSDQQPFDAKNPVREVPGRHGLGGWMIAVGGMELFLRLTGDDRYRERGLACLEHVLARHVHTPAAEEVGLPDDVWEFVDDDGRPYREGAIVRSDPGHACELAGLGLKLCVTAGLQDPRIRTTAARLGRILCRNFANGFASSGLGMVKSFDLAVRRPVNTDMPWWSLPETMRAALLCMRHGAGGERETFGRMFTDCGRAFVRHYVRPDRHFLAVQTLAADGTPAAAIPATPDLDPGYHTGLSLLDCLHVLESEPPATLVLQDVTKSI